MNTPFPEGSASRIRVRRNPRWLLAGIVAVVLGGLATAALVQSVAASEPVVRLNRTIHRGETITPADVSVVPVSRGLDVRTVPGARLDEVVGSAAITDLPQGSLLVAGTFGSAQLAAGESRVGVRVTAGRLPSSELVPGTPVIVVALPAANAAPTDADALPPSVRATLATSPAAQPDGSWVVDLTVPGERAEVVARLAALDRVAVVRVG